ncbi:MAG: zinc ribbon domain-containing protein [Proteobacteria bacterium]|nr:zinc ribbon domain-containing protein [Pseudomonadota bacterium]
MPIYEYECQNCHHQFDLMQKISENPITQCPKCFESTAKRLVSAAGFQLKGTGWYVTDFKNKNNSPKSDVKNESKANKTKKDE